MAILEEVKAEIGANRNRVYRFWFSAKQKRVREESKTDDDKRKPLFVMIDGKKHEYTECMSGDHLEKKSNWDDAIYLGETTWRNVIG